MAAITSFDVVSISGKDNVKVIINEDDPTTVATFEMSALVARAFIEDLESAIQRIYHGD